MITVKLFILLRLIQTVTFWQPAAMTEKRSYVAKKYMKHLKYANFIIDTKRRLLTEKPTIRFNSIIFSNLFIGKNIIELFKPIPGVHNRDNTTVVPPQFCYTSYI
jgi:hypothetical protein